MLNIGTRLVRSALYLPASNTRAIEKARTLAADAVIFDLEDSVAPDAKPTARATLEAAFESGKVARSLNVVRVNAHGTPDFKLDLKVAAQCRVDAVLVPKVSGAEEVADISAQLSQAFAGQAPALWCMVETMSGILRVGEIAALRTPQGTVVDCIVIGTNDIARESGVSMAQGRRYLLPWLMTVALASKANGQAVLDGVWNDFKDAEGFAAEAAQGSLMGFDGKTLIHPSQIDGANRAFAPRDDAVNEARTIVAAFARSENAGKGVVNMGGRMVERLHLDQAKAILRKHELIERRLQVLS